MDTSNSFLNGRRARRFEALQGCLVPLARNFTPEQKAESIRLINHILRSQPASQLKKLNLFLTLIEMTSIVTCGRSFAKLSHDRQERLLHLFFNSSLALFRKGFWGLNTLAKLGVYGQASVYSKINYRLREIPDG